MNSDLEDHVWLKALLEDNAGYIDSLIAGQHMAMRGEKVAVLKLSPSAYYSSDVIEAVQPILAVFDRLRSSVTFINAFPNARTYERQGITRDRWIEYHYAYFAIGYSSLRDLALLLTNAVFRLGTPPRSCTTDVILKNGWVAVTDVPKRVGEINALASSHAEIRNHHVHRGKAPNIAALLDDESYRHLAVITFANSVSPDFGVPRSLLTEAYRATSSELRDRMEDDIRRAHRAFGDLFASLHHVYMQKRSELQVSSVPEGTNGA